jgi:TrmH family RNA methyltransferase
LLTRSQRDRISIVLVSPRNPLNIGAVARAMANFGFSHLTVVDPYEPHWQEARSAVGSGEILHGAKESATLSEAVRDYTFVLGTGTLTRRKPEQPVVKLNELAPLVTEHLARDGRIAIVFGPEKHGLTREDLSYCHALVEISTDPQQPSMNLGQAAAVCLYELSTRAGQVVDSSSATKTPTTEDPAPASGKLDILADLVNEVMVAAGYSPKNMHAANRHDLRVMLRRLHMNAADQRRVLGLFRRILWRLR